MSRWGTDNISDLSKKVAIVTGANSGLGLEVVREFAGKGCHVVMACRSIDKAENASLHVRHEYPQASLEIVVLDLANLESIRKFSANFLRQHSKLDFLFNNAGVMDVPYCKTEDGFEMQFGTNHLGHFALTGLLLDRLLVTPGSRVITTSSMAHLPGSINFENLQGEKSYNGWAAYFQSKLANLLFSYELQRRLVHNGAATISVAAHPGWAATNLQSVGPQLAGSVAREKLAALLNRILAQSVEMGSLPLLYAASAPNVKGGEYIGPERFGWFGYPRKMSSSVRSRDEGVAERLWDVSEELTGVSYNFIQSRLSKVN